MSTADPPDLPLSPVRDGASMGEAQGLDQGARQVLDLSDLTQNLTKALGITISDGEGSKDQAPRGLDRERKGDQRDVNYGGLKGSWVGAVQGQKVLKKYEVEVEMKDGIGSVTVPEEITKDVAPLWDDFLIGKFLDDAPHIGKVHAIINKIWTINDKAQKIEVFEVNSTMMKFRIMNQDDRRRVLRRGMWNLAGVPVVVTKWSPVIEKEKPPTQSIPMWVHVKNVPLKLVSWQGLSFVTSPIGVPVRLHPETAQCLNLDVAKIFVKVDLTKDLPRRMNFNVQGEEVLVEYTYPWLPTKCEKCDKWGHSGKNCKKDKEEIRGVEKKDGEGITKEKENEEAHKEGMEKQKESETKSNHEERRGSISPEKENGRKTKETESEGNQKGEGNQAEWLDVSPGKASRSPPRFGQVSILTKSRFEVLSPAEDGEINEKSNEEEELLEGEELLEEEKLLEAEDSGEEIEEKEELVVRQKLPRDSKMNHRYLRGKTDKKAQDSSPSNLKKKKPRRH